MQTYTDEQKKIIGTDGNLIVNAFAGTGKSATAIGYVKHRPKEKFLYLVFNKSAADEMRNKLRKQGIRNVEARTIHSLAYTHIGHRWKSRLGDLGAGHLRSFGAELYSGKDRALEMRASNLLLSLYIDFLKSTDDKVGDMLNGKEYVYKEELDILRTTWDKVRIVCEKIWKDSLDINRGKFPLPHDFYLKVMQVQHSMMKKQTGYAPDLKYDAIILDEAQDVFPTALNLVLMQGSRKIFFGDRYQQIYGWNKSLNVLGKLEKSGAFSAASLTRSFRCPQDIADFVMPYLALLGNSEQFYGLEKPLEDKNIHAYLCRTNTGVMRVLTDLQEDGDAGKNFENVCLFGGADGYDFTEVLDCARLKLSRRGDIISAFVREFKSFEEFEDYAQRANDQRMQFVSRLTRSLGAPYIVSTVEKIRHGEFLASPEKNCVVVSTGHKSKGAEFDHVFLNSDFPVPEDMFFGDNSRRGKMLTEKESSSRKETESELTAVGNQVSAEELRLLYVAMTRAKQTLHAPAYEISVSKTAEIAEVLHNEQADILDLDENGKKISVRDRSLQGIKAYEALLQTQL